MVILGLDPGLASTGFGAIECGKARPCVIRCGFIRTSPKEHISNRLLQIHSDINQLVRTVRPDIIAVENVFSLVRYPRAGILLGGVLGIIYLTVSQNSIAMKEITPKEIKNSLVGHGGANKEQVRDTVRKVLDVAEIKSFHAADALAVALTAFYRNGRR